MPGMTRRQVLTGLAGASVVGGVAGTGVAAGLATGQWWRSAPVETGGKSEPVRRSPIWTATTGSPVIGITATPRTVYVGCQDHVAALDAASGTNRWQFSGKVVTAPVVSGGVVFVTTEGLRNSGAVSAVRARDGMVMRTFPGQAAISASGGITYMARDGVYAVRTNDAAAIADAWKFPDASAATVNGDIVFASGTERTYALRATDGTPLWSFPDTDMVQQVRADIVYLGLEINFTYDGLATGGGISARRASDGHQLWTFPADYTVQVTDRIAYAWHGNENGYGGRMHALRTEDGTSIWDFPTRGTGTPSLITDRGVVYIGTGGAGAAITPRGGGAIYALNAGTGTRLWRSSTLGDSVPSPYAATGVLYVSDGGLGGDVAGGMGAGGGGRVSALRSSDGVAIWSFQTSGSNPQLTLTRDTIYATLGLPINTASGNNTYALRESDGKERWGLLGQSLEIEGQIAYTGGPDGTVRAFRS